MNSSSAPVKLVSALLVVFLLSMTCVVYGQVTNAGEFWVSPSTNTTGLGTSDEPFDGSTRTKFDMVMSNLPAYSTLHIMAGTYTTFGGANWGFNPKSGQKFFGAGMDVTVIQFATNDVMSGAISSHGLFGGYTGVAYTNIVIQDLTFDSNYQPGCEGANTSNFGGISLCGGFNTINRVRCINEFGEQDVNAILLGTLSNGDFGGNNVVENCVVEHFHTRDENANCGGIVFWGVSRHNIIRDNRIVASDPMTLWPAIFPGLSDCLVEGNYVQNAAQVCYSESSVSNLTFIGNDFKGVGLVFSCLHDNVSCCNLTFAYNQISITNGLRGDGSPGGIVAFIFGGWGTVINQGYTNIDIFGNTISIDGPGAVGGTPTMFCSLSYVTGADVADNQIDPRMTNSLPGPCANLNFYNNWDLAGNYLYSVNGATINGWPVTSFGLGLIGQTGAANTLTTLGLPSMPSVLVTNNSSGITLAGAFNGNGYGLTNVTASALSGVGPVGQNTDGTSFTFAGGTAFLSSLAFDSNSIANTAGLAFAGGKSTNYSFAFGSNSVAQNNSFAMNGASAFSRSLAFGAAFATNGSFAVSPTANPAADYATASNFQWVATGFTGGYTFNDGAFGIGNNLTVGGTVTGNGSGLSGISDTNISNGANINVSKLKMPAGTLAYGSNGVMGTVFLDPSLVVNTATNVVGGTTNIGPTLSPNLFVSQLFAISNGLMANVPHGFSNTPSFVRWVLVCQTNHIGYNVGDEVDVASADANQYPAFIAGANSTNVFLVWDNNAFQLANKTNGNNGAGTTVDWKAKCYAHP